MTTLQYSCPYLLCSRVRASIRQREPCSVSGLKKKINYSSVAVCARSEIDAR